MSAQSSTTGVYSAATCSHLNPTLFAEKLPKQSNAMTLHQFFSILHLPTAVIDHITSLFNKHKFTIPHLPYLTQIDLKIVLSPPFPTPPLQCSCKPMNIITEALQTIAFTPTFPASSPATHRQQIISCLESYKRTAKMPVTTPSDVLERIEIQTSIRNILLSLLPQQLDVNVTIPSQKNTPTSFDIDRVVDDLQHCYALYIQEQDDAAQKEEHIATLADLGIEVPGTSPAGITPVTKLTPLSTSPPQTTTAIAGGALPNNPSKLSGRGPRPASSSLRPSTGNKYHTLNLRNKETNVSITKLDSYGNHTPIYGDESIDAATHAQALASPQASSRHTHSVFNSSSPSASTSGQGPSHYPTLGRILSSQPPQHSNGSASTHSNTSTPDHHTTHINSGIKTTEKQHPAPSPLVGPSTTAISNSSERATSLFARAQASLNSANQIGKSTTPTTTTLAGPPTTSPSPLISAATQPVVPPQPLAINTCTQSVDSFSLLTPRTRSGTNPNLSQLADRFAIGNTDQWVPYWKKNTKQIEEMLGSWDFAMFQDIQENHRTEILLRLAVFMFVSCGVVREFNMPIDKLARFLNHVSTLYRDNPYHNYLHAWTTLHYTYLLIKQTSANRRIEYSPTVVFSMLLASICHDIDHPGNNNHFEVQTMSKLAMLHNDNSVLENHHCFVTFSLLSRPEFSIMSNFTKPQLKECRGLIVSIILNTDMALHNDLTDSFGKASEELLNAANDSSGDSNTLSVKTSAAFALIARVLVHCSDIAGQALPLKSAYIWAMRLRDEFSNQADTEAKLGLPVTPFMTGLDDITFAKSQLGFIRGVLRPLWVRMSITFPATKPSLQHISDNEVFWQSFIEEYEKAEGKIDSLRNFSITSTLVSTPMRASISSVAANGPPRSKSGIKGRKYTLDEHYVRSLQDKELAQVPETGEDE